MSDDTLLKEMGERIYRRRKSLKLTQEELAEKLGVSTQMISNLELGKKAVRPENLAKLSVALNVSSDYVLFGRDKSSPAESLFEQLLTLSAEELNIITSMVNYMNIKNKEAVILQPRFATMSAFVLVFCIVLL